VLTNEDNGRGMQEMKIDDRRFFSSYSQLSKNNSLKR